MLILFNFLIVISFSLCWDMPDSYKAPTKNQFSKFNNDIPHFFLITLYLLILFI